jgi:plasmid stabilization system protein ParE
MIQTQASRQIDAAIDHIAVEHPVAALAWLERLLEQVASLATFPEAGRAVPEVGRDDLRELLVDPYRVICRRAHDRVEIVTLRHQRQELTSQDVS